MIFVLRREGREKKRKKEEKEESDEENKPVDSEHIFSSLDPTAAAP